MFFKIGVLKNFAIDSLFDKVAGQKTYNLLKRDSNIDVFL